MQRFRPEGDRRAGRPDVPDHPRAGRRAVRPEELPPRRALGFEEEPPALDDEHPLDLGSGRQRRDDEALALDEELAMFVARGSSGQGANELHIAPRHQLGTEATSR